MNVESLLSQLLKQADQSIEKRPPWKHRRRLVYMVTFLGMFMILFGMITFWWDRNVSVQLIIGGTAIVTIPLSAYVGFAAYEDRHLWKSPHDNQYNESSHEYEEGYNV